MRTTNRLIGSAIPRTEDLRFVRGAGEYVDDVSREGQLHAYHPAQPMSRMAGSEAGTSNTRCESRAYMRSCSAPDLPRPIPTVNIRLQPMPSLVPFHQPVLAETTVRYVGEPIAVVLADSSGDCRRRGGSHRCRDRGSARRHRDRNHRGAGTALLFPGARQQSRGRNILPFSAMPMRRSGSAAYRRNGTFRVHRHAAVPHGAARSGRRMGCQARQD